MINEIRTGIIYQTDGSQNTARGGRTGETIVADAHGRYAETSQRGNTYFLSVAAGAATAYVGAAGGTPLIGLHNPVSSGKNLVLLAVSAACRVIASATGYTTIDLWAGASVVPTGTQTSPRSGLTFTSGGAGLGFANAAMTGSTALNLVTPLISYYWGTTVASMTATTLVDLGGLVVLAPGMQAGLGATVAPASLTWDISMWWEEVAV